MLTLPIPLISSFVLGFLLLRRIVSGDRDWPFTLLLSACALQGAMIALVQHYGVDVLARVQPMTAAVIPPLAFVSFTATARGTFRAARDLWHAVPVGLVIGSALLLPWLLDVLIPALYTVYGVAILRLALAGADALPRMRLGTADIPARIWQVIGALLIASAFSDCLIVLGQILGHADWRPVIISLSTSVILLCVGILSVSDSLTIPAEPEALAAPVKDGSDPSEHAAVFAEVDRAIKEGKLFLDPDLTLDRLARKLRIPSKRISGAVNAETGENVSRYINRLRIAHACDALRAGASVTESMYGSGFNTKSNFNREFLRILGMSPTIWLRSAV